MVRDSVQLETVVNTISYEYPLDFTSEYGIPETLHPELPGPGDRIVDFPEGKAGEEYSQCYTKPLDSLKNWNNRFFWVDECVFPTVVDWRTNASKDGMPANEIDLFSLIRASNPTKVKTGSRPRAPYEVPLLTLTATRVIKMDEPAVAMDSSGVPSNIERSPLDFAHEAEASGRGTAAPKMPPPEDVPTTTAPGADQAGEAVAAGPPVARESRKRGHDGTDANAPPKSLRRDHTDLLLAMDSSGVPSNIEMSPLDFSHEAEASGRGTAAPKMPSPEDVPTTTAPEADQAGEAVAAGPSVARESRKRGHDGTDANAPPNDPDPLAFADAPSSQGVAAAEDPESENVPSPAEVVSSGGVSGEETLKAAFEDYKQQQDQLVKQRCAEMDARLDALSIDFDEELYLHMLTAIWHGLRLALMKCAESLEMRQAFADVVSTGVAKGMREGLKHRVEHGHAKLTVESLEAYDPEAEAKFAAALQSLKDLKSDGIPVSVPTVVPQGLDFLLVDAATQTDLEDA
nr:hypothetical protein [Tanacetum cinerariifolium]